MDTLAIAAWCRGQWLTVGLCLGLLVGGVDAAAAGAGPELRFQRVLEGTETIKQNASALTSITQDRTGFMWFGGENGLARFDGVRFKRYDHHHQRGGLPSNHVRDLAMDAEGVMWVATDRGLCRYYPEVDRFEVFKPSSDLVNSLPHNVVTSIAVGRHNHLVLGTGHGISLFSPDRATFTHISLATDSRKRTFVYDTFVDSKNRIWVGSRDNGLYLLSPQGQLIRHFRADPSDSSALQSDTIKAIEEDQFGRIWVGTYGGGLSRLREGERDFVNYLHDAQQKGSIGSNTIWDIYLDSDDQLWISTDQGGLALYQQQADRFVHFRASIHDRFTLSSNQVRTIFEDRDRNLWIANFPNGINFFDRAHSQVNNFTHKHGVVDSLSHSAVLDFLQTSDGILWIGTEEGLNQFDVSKQKFVGRFTHADGLHANSVLSLEEDFNGELWVGTWSGGLHRLDRINQNFTHYGPSSSARYLNSAFIWDIFLDSQNTLWVGTENGGLSRYNRDSDSFTAFVHDQEDSASIASNFVWSVLEDSRGGFWVATADGLDLMDRESGRFHHLSQPGGGDDTIDSMRIRALYEDRKGRIWVGTQDVGVYLYHPTEKRFTHVRWPSSLSPLVTSFIEDNLGVIWASTGNGIARIEPDTLEVRSFHKAQGLVGDNFNRDATFKDDSGHLYFGGTEGFSVFDPRVFSRSESDYPLVLTDFKLFNRSVSAADQSSPLARAITYAEKIALKHSDSMFSFNFAVLDYHSPLEYRFAYRLDGFDHQWHEVAAGHTATYTNIDPGRYVFRVKSANRDGVWNKNAVHVQLAIAPSPWQSWWALVLYTLLFLIVITWLWRSFTHRSLRSHKQRADAERLRLTDAARARRIRDAQEAQLPLKTIIAQAEAVLEDYAGCLPGNTEQRLLTLTAQAHALSTQISDTIDYGAYAERAVAVDRRPISIYAVVEDCLRSQKMQVHGKPISLINEVAPACAKVVADPKHLRRIMTALIDYALEHADSGEVRIHAHADEGMLITDVSNCELSAEQTRALRATLFHAPVVGEDKFGLPLAQYLAHIQGGEISYIDARRAEPVTGACLRVRLPLAEPQDDPLPATHSLQRSSQQSAPSAEASSRIKSKLTGDLAPPDNAQQYRVLVVDDDPINRIVLSGILGLHQYTVVEAGSGPEALNMIMHQAQPVDLVILDVMMPRMSGFEVCERLRQVHSQQQLPILFLTAKHGEEDVRRGLSVGGNEVLYKPVSKEVLLPRVRQYLAKR